MYKPINSIFLLLFFIGACSQVWEEPTCSQSIQNFVSYFNAQQFRKVRSLFQSKTLDRQQYKRMQNNLTYVYSVAGPIQSIQYLEQQKNLLVFKTNHRYTAMEVRFLFNDQCQLKSYQIDTHYPDSLPRLERNKTAIGLPFEGEWYVVWGGPSLEQNYHNAHRNMRGAFDFSIKDASGNMHRGKGNKNEDYYAFGKEILAPCKAVVEKVITGVKDNPVGKPNALKTYGNAVVLRTPAMEYLLLAHLKSGSVVVKEGQKVDRGTVLAQCGNSGYSSEPHLHFIVQNVPDLFHPTGASCYFDKILVNSELKEDYSPVQGELVKNYGI